MKPEYSVVICCYYEEKSINEFYSRLSSSLEKCGRSYEIVFVNDGSNDNTFEQLKDIYNNDEKVYAVIDFFRNFGQASAITAGLEIANGNHFVLLDSDLQLDPEELPMLMDEFEKGYDIVSGYRKNRKDNLFRKISSKLANIVMRKVSGHSLSDYGCTFKIYHGKLIRGFELGSFKKFDTSYIFSRAGKVKEVPVTHHNRKYGESGWTKSKLFAFYMDNMVGVSQRPFQYISFLCLFGVFLFFSRLSVEYFYPIKILENVSNGLILNIIVMNLLIILAVLSIIGEYAIRNFLILQNYPVYVIREIFKKKDKSNEISDL